MNTTLVSTLGDTPRILIVRLSAIGDCLHAVPVVEEIRRQCPEAHIGWVIQRGGLRLLQSHPAVDRFHVFERGSKGLARLGSLRQLRRELHAQRYDVAVDLQGLSKSGVIAHLAGARTTLGFAAPESRELNGLFVRHRIRVNPAIEHVVDRNLALLEALGLTIPERPSWTMPQVDLSNTEIGGLLARLERVQPRPLAVLSPGTTWPTKVWPQERFAALAKALVQTDVEVLVAWAGDQEQAMAEHIVATCMANRQTANRQTTDQGSAKVHKAPATSLTELCGLMQRSDLVVANDSGPLHLAVAVGAKAIGVYGPTDPARNGPYGWNDPSWASEAVTVADMTPTVLAATPAATPATADQPVRNIEQNIGGGKLMDCQFCWKTACRRGDTACLEQLDAAPVIQRALALLEAGDGR